MLLREAFEGFTVHYVCTDESYAADVPGCGFSVIPDANIQRPFYALRSAVRAARLIARLRPRLVVSTGAAPGLFTVLVASVFRLKTIWIESMAGVTQLTLSGRLAQRVSTRFIVQWPELAAARNAEYYGSLL